VVQSILSMHRGFDRKEDREGEKKKKTVEN
jgi:hypothetical protein